MQVLYRSSIAGRRSRGGVVGAFFILGLFRRLKVARGIRIRNIVLHLGILRHPVGFALTLGDELRLADVFAVDPDGLKFFNFNLFVPRQHELQGLVGSGACSRVPPVIQPVFTLVKRPNQLRN